MALYRAKSEGRGSYRLFEANMDARQQELFLLEQELRQAVDGGQLELEYQPIVETLSRAGGARARRCCAGGIRRAG